MFAPLQRHFLLSDLKLLQPLPFLAERILRERHDRGQHARQDVLVAVRVPSTPRVGDQQALAFDQKEVVDPEPVDLRLVDDQNRDPRERRGKEGQARPDGRAPRGGGSNANRDDRGCRQPGVVRGHRHSRQEGGIEEMEHEEEPDHLNVGRIGREDDLGQIRVDIRDVRSQVEDPRPAIGSDLVWDRSEHWRIVHG